MAASRHRITVINPNSNIAVTSGIDDAVEPLRSADGPEIACVTLDDGPFGIESQAHVEQVTKPLRDKITSDDASSAFVIACYSDPGLHVCREATARRVFGINECAVLTALAHGDTFGVLAIKEASIKRHVRYLRQMALIDRLAAERALDLTVAETASGEETFARMCATGRQLRDVDRADVIIMGCAGMARHRQALEAELGIPVIDPCQAAVTMAIGAVRLLDI
ncbi:MAG: aspartate/glutamate racemase family protein [Pseudomonadota bacterium]